MADLREKIHAALESDDATRLERLVDEHPDGDPTLPWPTVIVDASARGAERCTAVLIEKGVSVSGDGGGASPLFHAARLCSPELVELLIDGGASVADEDGVLNAVLLRSLRDPENQVAPLVRLLLDAGADPNIPIGDPPLSWAAIFNRLDVAQLLIDYGADPMLADEHGFRPWHRAMGADVRDLLRRHEPDEVHDPAAIGARMRAAGVPDGVIDLIDRGEHMLGRPVSGPPLAEGEINHAVLYGHALVKFFTWNDEDLVDLCDSIDGEACYGGLAWSVRDRCLVALDRDRGHRTVIGDWAPFYDGLPGTLNQLARSGRDLSDS